MNESGDVLVMADAPLSVRPCSVAAALEIVGERWSLLAVREIGYGVHRFSKIAAYIGASRDMLADRLRKLENAGIIERRQYSEHPPRYEYHLTEAGRELFPVMLALREWIAPRLQLARVQVSEAGSEQTPQPQSSPSGALGDTGALAAQYQMRMEHFLKALEEQNERYAAVNASNEAQRKQEEGRQRLMEMAANYGPDGQKPLKGFRLFLARLFRLV